MTYEGHRSTTSVPPISRWGHRRVPTLPVQHLDNDAQAGGPPCRPNFATDGPGPNHKGSKPEPPQGREGTKGATHKPGNKGCPDGPFTSPALINSNYTAGRSKAKCIEGIGSPKGRWQPAITLNLHAPLAPIACLRAGARSQLALEELAAVCPPISSAH